MSGPASWWARMTWDSHRPNTRMMDLLLPITSASTFLTGCF